jgi:aminomethyltransferase
MATSPLLKTACHDWHVSHGARMVDFAGWEMPVQYASIVAEHHAVRRCAGLFDIGHMGRLRISGTGALPFLEKLLTCDVAGLSMGQARYSLLTNEQGGILDDLLVYRFADHYLLVVNASNRLKIVRWLALHLAPFDVEIEDETLSTGMVALQGPRAVSILQPLCGAPLAELNSFFAVEAAVAKKPVIVSRTGYTGEDGFELIGGLADAAHIWRHLLEAGATMGLAPSGLGARDTLRLEAAMPLYGHELDESIDPYTAGLGFAVKRDGKEFIGCRSLEAARTSANRRKRVGLLLAGKRIAREHSSVRVGEDVVGRVTSGTFSPTLERSIAMAYIEAATSTPGTAVQVEIRGQTEPAQVVKLPFYQRSKGS